MAGGVLAARGALEHGAAATGGWQQGDATEGKHRAGKRGCPKLGVAARSPGPSRSKVSAGAGAWSCPGAAGCTLPRDVPWLCSSIGVSSSSPRLSPGPFLRGSSRGCPPAPSNLLLWLGQSEAVDVIRQMSRMGPSWELGQAAHSLPAWAAVGFDGTSGALGCWGCKLAAAAAIPLLGKGLALSRPHLCGQG